MRTKKSIILLVSFLLVNLIMMSAVTYSGNDEVLARVTVTTTINDVDLPIYEQLSDIAGNDYVLVKCAASALDGYEYTVIDVISEGSDNYLLAYDHKRTLINEARAIVDVLYYDGVNLIAKTDMDKAVAIAELGFDIKWLNDTPLITEQKRAVVKKDIFFEDVVAAIVNEVQQTTVVGYGNKLTGVQPISVGGQSYTLSTRNTYSGTSFQKAVQYAYEFFQTTGLDVSYHNWSSYKNIVAEQRGEVNPDEIVIILAHLDDMPSSGRAPGADDNASGSVGVMMAAEIMSQYRFEKTIRYVLVTGEEQGLLGSKAYANSIAYENVIAVFNMDMISFDGNGDGLMTLHTRKTSDPDYLGDKAIGDIFVKACELYGLGNVVRAEVRHTGLTFSDHSAFWAKDFYSVLACEDYPSDETPYYHTSNDTMQTIHHSYWTNFIKLSLATTAHLAEPYAVPTPTPTTTPTPTITPTPTFVPQNLALHKPIYASSIFAADYAPKNAVDGIDASLWGSKVTSEPEYIYVDLETIRNINGVTLKWFDNFYPRKYKIALSQNGKDWTFVYTQLNGKGGNEILQSNTSVITRYIGIYLMEGNGAAYGLKELEVYNK